MYTYTGKLNFYDLAENEMITVIVPGDFVIGSHICVYWKWTTVAKEEVGKENVVYDGIIDKSDFSGRSAIIGFCCDSTNSSLTCYRFDGKVDMVEKTMELTINSTKDGRNKSFKLELNYEDFLPTNTLVVKLYTGKFNWYEHAVNEMITVILPAGFEKNAPISAYWQWTKAADGTENKIMIYDGFIDVVHFSDKSTTICFHSVYADSVFAPYRFKADVTEGGSIMDVTMKCRSDGFDFIALGLSYSGTDSSGKRISHDKTSTIVNDTDEAYLCELQASDTTERNRILAAIGLTVSVVPTTLNPPTVSWTIPNIVGGEFTIGGILEVNPEVINEWTKPDIVAKLLFPGESISRTAGLPILFRSANAIKVIKLSLEKRNEESSNLVISVGVKSGLVHETYQLKDILKNTKFEKFFEFILRIPGSLYLKACTLIKIPGLKPMRIGDGTVETNDQALDQLACGQIYTAKADTGDDIISYGPHRCMETFVLDAATDFLFLEQDGEINEEFKIIRMKLPNCDRVLLKMENYNFFGLCEMLEHGVPNRGDEEGALALIAEKWAKDGDCFAFLRQFTGEVVEYKHPPTGGRLGKTAALGSSLYLTVPWKATYSRICKFENAQ